MANQKIMRDIGLNEPVSIELPAHIWLAFMAAYAVTEWESSAAHSICLKIQDAVMDPIYLNEQLAAAQLAHDGHRNIFHHLFGGADSDAPPDTEGM